MTICLFIELPYQNIQIGEDVIVLLELCLKLCTKDYSFNRLENFVDRGVKPTPSALLLPQAKPGAGGFKRTEGDKGQAERCSGVFRRLRKSRSDWNGNRWDTERKLSVSTGVDQRVAAKQRGDDSALLLPQAEPGAGGFKCSVGRKRQAERCSGVFRRLRKPRKPWSGWSANRWDTERKLSVSFGIEYMCRCEAAWG